MEVNDGWRKEVTDRKRLVLDADIFLRAVFGVRVRALLQAYEDSVSFYAPDLCLQFANRGHGVPAHRSMCGKVACQQ